MLAGCKMLSVQEAWLCSVRSGSVLISCHCTGCIGATQGGQFICTSFVSLVLQLLIDFHVLQGHVALGAMERKDIIHLREGLCQTSNEENRGNSLLRATKQPCVAPCCRTSQDTGGGDLSIGKGH